MMTSSSTYSFAAAVIAAAASLHQTHAFVLPTSISTASSVIAHGSLPQLAKPATARSNVLSTLYMSETPTNTQTSALALTLEKPLGLILEESEDGIGGVMVTAVNEGGSAYDHPQKEQMINAKISTVMGSDVSTLSFDDVMDVIIGAPSPFDIEFAVVSSGEVAASESGEEVEAAEPAAPAYEIGATVTITVEQPEQKKAPITLEAKVGDNLRTTLLANGDIELYRGLKKKLGNCGGGGQCGFCAVELIDEEGVWGERIEYEANKIGKNGSEKCRLACVNNIVGPATVRTL